MKVSMYGFNCCVYMFLLGALSRGTGGAVKPEENKTVSETFPACFGKY